MNKCRAAATQGVCPEKYANWRLRWRLCRMVGANFFKNIVIKLSVKYDFYQSAFVGHYPSSINLVHTKEMFADSVEVEFEGDKYLAPIGYKQYLTQLYGDYMQMPPEDKRITHCVKAILKD